MTRSKTLSLAVAPVAALMLSGCVASSDRYPSLAIRDIERVSGTFEVAEPDAAPQPSLTAAELASLPGLLETARDAHQRFLDAAPGARRDVAAAIGSGADDNRWSSAQVAMANLESLRSQAAIPLADLDRLHVEAATSFADKTEVDEARAEVITLITEEDRILAELRGRLAQ